MKDTYGNNTGIVNFEMLCENCIFYKESSNDNWSGQCHRHAPNSRVEEGSQPSGLIIPVWPVTSRRDWCGDWEKLPNEPLPPSWT